MKPPIGHNTPPTDGWVLSARQIKRVWDTQQGGSHNIRREIETHGIEWMRFEDSRDSSMVFGGRMRTAATARPRRPSDGKNRWVTETDADALREANTH